jgi:D-aspartate ligase
VKAAHGPSAVIVGLDTLAGLQTARLLRRRGIPVVGVAADRRHPACHTRSCVEIVIAAPAGEELLEVLVQLGTAYPGAVLIPCTDAAVSTIATARYRLEDLRIVLPPTEVIDTLAHEHRLAAHAAAHGIPVPAGRTITSVSDAVGAADQLGFPIAVKPVFRTPAWGAAGASVLRFDDPATWIRSAPSLLERSPALRLQEWINGPHVETYSCTVYVSPQGIPIRTFVARKVRQWPPVVGNSCCEVAVHDDDIRDLALDTISPLPFFGLGSIEVRRDTRTGRDVVVDANVGRPTGRSAIAEAVGVELLLTLYLDAIGARLPDAVEQRDQPMTWFHLSQDLRASWLAIRRGQLTVAGWWRSLRGPTFFADLDRHDPMPTLVAIGQALGRRRPAVRHRPADPHRRALRETGPPVGERQR